MAKDNNTNTSSNAENGKTDLEQLIKEIRELQEIELGILVDVDRLCKEHNIRYFLGEGTLLGAIRHNGFIPWDDDVDIIMPREDYNRFLEIAPELLKPKYEVQHSTTVENYWSPFIKIRLLDENQKYRQAHIAHLTNHNGALIDIFPLEYVPDPGSRKLERQHFAIHFFRMMLFIKLGLKPIDSYKKRLIKFAGHFYSVKRIHKRLDKEFNRYNDKKRQYIGSLATYHKLNKLVVPASVYEESIDHEFEGHVFPVPKEFDLLLRTVYGDYMELPPEEQRYIKHFFTADH